ncbi:DUF2726 domain-containing protein [Acinetobacter ursingii]|uniref:DUF2726 domain-containing protein n=3 Tax=Acinetobacter ursingii TaxID=108980 RepID=A0AA46S3T3_9GAMM|nr:DUF2726 domain-containing protein [Acinetobacter ursingii]UYF72059.1 DUF2726 domain-containing protein [Acinetobacter ursingii]
MPLLLIVIGIIVFGILAAALIKPKKLSEAEKREQARKRILEQDKRERDKRLKLEEKAKEEARIKLDLEEKQKAEEVEKLRLEDERKNKVERDELLETEKKLEAETINSVKEAEDDTLKEIEESEEETLEVEKKPLEEVIRGKIRKSRPLTMNEQPMFKKLRDTLEPEFVVLSQVSFGAILWTRYKSVRNRFNRKIVDFVICDKGFNVIAVIELDDSSHKGKEERDSERDLLLNEAGITVFRYKLTPESSKILEDIKSVKL